MSEGILITDGVSFRLSGLSITINRETGEVQMGDVKAQMHYDVTPVWLEIAINHLKVAADARQRRRANKQDKNVSLESEFVASMQAVTGAATAIDAFYAVVKRNIHQEVSPEDEKRSNKASRAAYIAETLRIAFQLKSKGFQNLRHMLGEIYKFRGFALHPSGQFSDPVLHPELNVGVERRLVIFEYENAFKIVQAAVAIISELALAGKARNEELRKYANGLAVKAAALRADPLLNLPEMAKD
jgi:hypothetical protein